MLNLFELPLIVTRYHMRMYWICFLHSIHLPIHHGLVHNIDLLFLFTIKSNVCWRKNVWNHGERWENMYLLKMQVIFTGRKSTIKSTWRSFNKNWQTWIKTNALGEREKDAIFQEYQIFVSDVEFCSEWQIVSEFGGILKKHAQRFSPSCGFMLKHVFLCGLQFCTFLRMTHEFTSLGQLRDVFLHDFSPINWV